MIKLVVGFLLFCLVAPAIALQQPAGGEVRAARSSVYSFVLNGETICTGFVVKGTEPVLMTAGHCARDLEETDRVYAFNSETSVRYPLKFQRAVEKWPLEDFAIFTFPGDKPEGGLTTTRTIPEVGDAVWSVEGPLAIAPVLVAGTYAGRLRRADNPKDEVNGMYCLALPATQGSSGSPVLDSQGRVWGILVGGNGSLDGFCFVVLITA